MADGFVGLDPDSTGKKVDMSELLVGGVTVERERMVLSDNADALAFAAVKNAAPAGTDYGLVTRDLSGLTDTQLRASAVPVSGPLTDAQLRALAVPVSGPLTDAQLRAAAVPVSGPLTDAQLRAVAVPVSGTFFQATQPVSGTFFQATQPISAAALPLPAGAATEATLDARTGALVEAAPATDTASSGLNGRLQRIAQRLTSLIALLPASLGQKVMASSLAVTLASDQSALPAVAEIRAASLHVTATAAVNTAVTLTLPAVAGQFHYITSIQIVKLYAVVGTAAAAGVLITTTNLPGNPVWTTEQAAGTLGSAPKVVDYQPTTPLKSSVVNTATTIVCPLQAQTIWRVNVSYFTAP